jgi:hypothetical protein
MRSNTQKTIAVRIIRYIDDLRAIIREGVEGALHAEVAAAIAGAGREAGPSRRGRKGRAVKAARPLKAGKRRTATQLGKITARLLRQIRKTGGQRIEQIGAAMKVRTSVLKLPVEKLLAAKKIKTTGAKRGTKYFVR